MRLFKPLAIIAALQVLPLFSPAAEEAGEPKLETQILGYWAPDADAMQKLFTEEHGFDEKNAATMVAESSKMTFHVEKATLHVFTEQGVMSVPYEIEKTDPDKKSITARAVNPPGAPKAQPVTFTVEGKQITVVDGQMPFVLKEIDEAEFKKRKDTVPATRIGP